MATEVSSSVGLAPTTATTTTTTTTTGPPGTAAAATAPTVPTAGDLRSGLTPQHAGSRMSVSPMKHHQWSTRSYLGNGGYMPLFAYNRPLSFHTVQPHVDLADFDMPPEALRDSFAETYQLYCSTWCPVLDAADLDETSESAHSPLLVNALALAATQIQPSMIQHASSEDYYQRAKRIFQNGQEKDPITCVKAIALFYWWSPVPPLVFSLDSIWWWTGVAIRIAQEMGLHRDSGSDSHKCGIRRRVWWTLYARERLTALSLERPCIINPDDCDVSEPTLADFPDPTDLRAEIFIRWVRLCGIAGRIGESMRRRVHSMPTISQHLQELSDWVLSVPPHLQLAISTSRTTNFNRDISQLYLPYFTTVILLHLTRSSSTALPKASTAAIMAASCTARIFQDLLVRGSIRYLPALSTWFITIACLPLVYARHIPELRDSIDEHIHILRIGLRELNTMYPGTDITITGLERLLNSTREGEVGSLGSGEDWLKFFPFITPQTSPLAAILLAGTAEYLDQTPPELLRANGFMLEFDDLLNIINLPAHPGVHVPPGAGY